MTTFIAVDDERLALQGLTMILEQVVPSVHIEGFRKASEALEYAEKNPVHTAFLDVQMKGMQGIELGAKLHEINPDMNIVYTTGFSEYAPDAFNVHASGYIMKPVTREKVELEIQHLRNPLETKNRIYAQTFGNFEVFCDGEPIRFKYSKTKEMLAYLIDRRGAECTNGELTGILWEDDAPETHKSYLKGLKKDLSDTFEELGIDAALNRARSSLGIVTDLFDCDYYSLLKEDESAIAQYQGEYMAQYSWGEMTNSTLYERYGD